MLSNGNHSGNLVNYKDAINTNNVGAWSILNKC